MSTDRRISYEQVISGVLSPWYDGKNLAAGDGISNAKDAATHGVVAALNVSDDQRGVVRILVRTSEEKREVYNHLVAYLNDAPALKKMLKRTTVDTFHLHGGVSIMVDANSARLAKNVISQIVIDPEIGAPLGTFWLAVDGNDIETKEDACIRRGIDPALAPQCMAVRWQTDSEAETAAPPPWDDPEPGPPRDEVLPPTLEEQQAALEAQQAAATARRETEERYRAGVEARQREIVAEKISGHFANIRQKGV